MAIPILYWMLECTNCGRRRVVHDCYLVLVGTTDPDPVPGTGYTGPPLPERYGCSMGCSKGMRVIGSIDEPGDRIMWLDEPHEPIAMDQQRIAEWLLLIKEAGLA
jgi:hypothetical protein